MTRLRAVIYARCSTEEESQKDALVNQVAEAKECVVQNGWILVGTYVESRSGTSTKGRAEYNRLFDDLQKNLFDLIVIKSQDRLMRNTKDWYLFVDRLITEQKKLYMYIDRKFYSTDDALITGIKAILAEDYSRELSKKINNAHKTRQTHSGNPIITGNVYGFRRLPDKSIVLVEEEAKVKKHMYELSAAGFGARTIATILKNEGVLNRKGIPFEGASIRRIIRSPLNKGTVVMNKRHYDFDSKKTFQVPEEEWIVYENKVPAIVSEELWELANKQIDGRLQEKPEKWQEHSGRYRGKYLLTGKLECGLCGERYYRKTRRRYRDGTPIYEWACRRYIYVGRNAGRHARPQLRKVNLEDFEGCDNVHLDEEKLNTLLEKICEETYRADKERIVQKMLSMLKIVLREKSLQPSIDQKLHEKEKLKEQLNLLVDKLLSGVLSDEAYKSKQQQVEQKLELVQAKIQELEEQREQEVALKDRIKSIEELLRGGKAVEEATVAGMLEDVRKIKVFPEYLEVYFSFSKLLGVDGCENMEGEEPVRIEVGHLFNYRQQKKEGQELVVDMMRKNPGVTAKMIAEELGLSLSGANYRIKALKRDGKIRFNGRGGSGQWEVLADNQEKSS